MGTKRTFDTGRFDTLNRRIKDSGNKRNPRAKDINAEKKALDDFYQIATEFNNEVENSVERGMEGDLHNAEDSAHRAAYLYGIYRKWSDEVLNIDHEEGKARYSQFREKYGLGKGQKVKVDPRKMYGEVDKGDIGQAYEAAYDVLSSQYSDRFTEEEMNSYREKVNSYQEGYGYEEAKEEGGERYSPEPQSQHPEDNVRSQNIYSRFSRASSARYRAAKNKEGKDNIFGGGGGFPPRGSGRIPGGFGGGRGAFGLVEDVSGLGNRGSFRVTWRPKLGPFVMNMGRKGPASVSAHLGPLRYMVWQKNRGWGAWFSSFDLPSVLSFRGHRK